MARLQAKGAKDALSGIAVYTSLLLAESAMQLPMRSGCPTLMVPPTTSPVSAASARCSSSPPKHGLKPGSWKHGVTKHAG